MAIMRYKPSNASRKKQMGAYFSMPHMLLKGVTKVLSSAQRTQMSSLLALAFHDKIGASLFQKCGTRTRIVDIRKGAGIRY